MAGLVVAGLTLSALTLPAQNASAPNASQPAVAGAPTPQLSRDTSQILRMARANVGEPTIIAYIKSSGNSYGLDADQIIYLRQQGISDAIITTMLSQPHPPALVSTPMTPAPQPPASIPAPATVVTSAAVPAVTYVQTVPPPPYYYYQPYYYPYYPSYSVFPALSLSFEWGSGGGHGGGWHGGGGWHH